MFLLRISVTGLAKQEFRFEAITGPNNYSSAIILMTAKIKLVLQNWTNEAKGILRRPRICSKPKFF